MTVIAGIIGFVLGIGFTLFMFSNEIYHGQKVGYEAGDIHPNHDKIPNFFE